MKKKLSIVKIGGNVLNRPEGLDHFLEQFASLEGPKILIHGGGRLLDELAAKLEIPQQMTNGRRITDADTLRLAVMVYAGTINKQIVASLQAKGQTAIGLCGADANSIPATRRSPVPQDFGLVGDVNPKDVNTAFLSLLLQQNICPVFSAITHDARGQLLNTNADTQASALAIALAEEYAVQLVYCFEKKGVLQDPDNEDSVISTISREQYHLLKAQQCITEGMIPKLDNAFAALQQGVAAIAITHAQTLLLTFASELPAGTHLVT